MRRSGVQIVKFAMISALGGVVGYFAAKFGVQLLLPVPGPKALKLITLAAVVPAWLLAVAWHELGHLVGGWIGGGRFLLWIVGPFKVQRTPSGIRCGWNRSLNLSGGLAACLPLDPAKMNPRRAAVMIFGGPLFSLVLAVAAFWFAAELAAGTEPASAARALSQHVAMLVAGLSALVFMVTAAPSSAGGFKSDGKRALDLLRGDARSEHEAALLVLTTASLAGQRPADYDPTLVRRALSLNDGSLFDLYARVAIFYHEADSGRWREAQQLLDDVLVGEGKLVPYLRDVVRCEYAWLLATRSNDVNTARAWLDSAGALEFDPATRLRAEAAVLLAEGRRQDALAKARDASVALDRRSFSPVRNPFASDAIAEIERRATN